MTSLTPEQRKQITMTFTPEQHEEIKRKVSSKLSEFSDEEKRMLLIRFQARDRQTPGRS
jgi:hypothetical protein